MLLQGFCVVACCCRVVVYTSYLDDEKKQVLQLYGQRSDEATTRCANVLCDIPTDMENPSLLVTGRGRAACGREHGGMGGGTGRGDGAGQGGTGRGWWSRGQGKVWGWLAQGVGWSGARGRAGQGLR